MDPTTRAQAEEQIADLLRDPHAFERAGKSNELLQHYFRGYPVESLRPLLLHPDAGVKRVALWLAAELPQQMGGLLDCIIPFLADSNVFERQHALQTVFLCAKGDDLDKMLHVFLALEDPDPTLRERTMSLLLNASVEQLSAASGDRRNRLGPSRNLHAAGITVLVQEPPLESNLLEQLITHEEPLFRRYAAIAAERNWETRPDAALAAERSAEPDIREFAIRARKRHQLELELRRRAPEREQIESAATSAADEQAVWLQALKQAFALIREVAKEGDAKCAEELAEAFHELPGLLASQDRAALGKYGEQYIAPLLWKRPRFIAHFGALAGAPQHS